MRNYLLATLLLITNRWAGAQEFAFVPSSKGSDIVELKGYKKDVAQKVFDALIHARGDYRMQQPTLVLNKKEGDVAIFNPDGIQVVLDEKAYDICAGFGKDSINALAALLAHELIHYYEKHAWSRHFARGSEPSEVAKRIERIEDRLKQETQADNLGGFLAFSAGFNTYGIMTKLLPKIYREYDFQDNLPGYPSLQERLKMVDGAMTELQGLQIVFETANLLTFLGNYADASVYHRHILQTYQSREMYNNAGVNTTLAALALMEPTRMPYVWPLELDPSSRLFGIKNNDAEKDARIEMLLKWSMDYFERAIVLDLNYSPSYLNKACVLALKADWEEAEDTVRKGRKKATDPQNKSDFLVLEGLLAALQQDTSKALSLWETALKQGNRWAKTNIDILKRVPRSGVPATAPVKGLEEIEQFPLADFLASPNPDREVKVAENIYCGMRQFAHSRIFIHYANKGKSYVVVQETQSNYPGQTLRGIKLGDTEAQVLKAYGTAPRTVGLRSGQVWIYPDSNIFFRMSPDSKVESWGVYRKSIR